MRRWCGQSSATPWRGVLLSTEKGEQRDERGRNGRSTGRRRRGRRSSGSGGDRARARGQRWSSGLWGLLSSRWISGTRARGVAGCRRLVVLDDGGAPLQLGSSEATRRKQARGRGLDPSWIGRRLAAGEIERGGAASGSIGQGRIRDGSRCGFRVEAAEKDGWDISLKFRVLV